MDSGRRRSVVRWAVLSGTSSAASRSAAEDSADDVRHHPGNRRSRRWRSGAVGFRRRSSERPGLGSRVRHGKRAEPEPELLDVLTDVALEIRLDLGQGYGCLPGGLLF